MNDVGYTGIVLFFVGLFGLATMGLVGGSRWLLETYLLQSCFLAGLIVVGVILLWLNIKLPNDPPQRGM